MEQTNNLYLILKTLKEKFKAEISELNIDNNQDFHNNLISISTKYPEQRELIEFIVLVNDNLVTKHKMYMEVISSHLLKLIEAALTAENGHYQVENLSQPEAKKQNILKIIFKNKMILNNLKIIFLSIAGIFSVIFFIILSYTHPELLIKVLKLIVQIF